MCSAGLGSGQGTSSCPGTVVAELAAILVKSALQLGNDGTLQLPAARQLSSTLQVNQKLLMLAADVCATLRSAGCSDEASGA